MIQSFGFEPTDGQAIVLYHLSAFLLSQKENPTYILRGYAGTGKTTLVKTLVKTLPYIGMRYVLMAPTGRAAKVLSSYTGQGASTIHRRIYQAMTYPDGSIRIARAENKFKNALFIVDEASMIGEQKEFGGSSLLDDLLSYVFSGENCRLFIVGVHGKGCQKKCDKQTYFFHFHRILKRQKYVFFGKVHPFVNQNV